MIDGIFPDNESSDMTDEEWIDYCIGVWCCNSLNARAGALRYKDPFTSELLHRAQQVITYLRENDKRVINETIAKWVFDHPDIKEVRIQNRKPTPEEARHILVEVVPKEGHPVVSLLEPDELNIDLIADLNNTYKYIIKKEKECVTSTK